MGDYHYCLVLTIQVFENQALPAHMFYLSSFKTPLSISDTVSQRISISSEECDAIRMVFPFSFRSRSCQKSRQIYFANLSVS